MAAEGETTYDVFVSYRWGGPDESWVRGALVPALKAAGLSVILDVDVDQGFQLGLGLMAEMSRAVTQSRHTLCVLSPEYFEGRMAEFELLSAQWLEISKGRSVLIPFQLRETPQAPPWMARLIAVNWSRPDGRRVQWTRLLRRLSASNADADLPVAPEAWPPVEQPMQRRYANLKLEKVLQGGDDELFSVAFSPNDRLIACGSDGKILLWDRDKGDTLRSLEGHESYVYSVAFSHDGSLIASGAEDEQVQVWDVQSGRMLWSKRAHQEAVYSVAFSPDGKLLATGSYDRTVKLWDVESAAFIGESGDTMRSRGLVSSIAFSPDGALLGVGRLDNSVTLWDHRTGRAYALKGHTSSVETIAFSRDGKLLASGGLDKKVIVWDVERRVKKWVRPGHEYLIRSVAFSPDSTTVASASWDKTVRLWNIEKGDHAGFLPFDRHLPREKRLPWHSDWIWCVAFSSDAKLLATGGSDGQLILWSVGEAHYPTLTGSSP